ncbi:MAG: hypothetical protein K6B75_05165 [Lachnospiraceae bacterium]|nr:hypothetical protein [Lachnospiraceae bacterium]
MAAIMLGIDIETNNLEISIWNEDRNTADIYENIIEESGQENVETADGFCYMDSLDILKKEIDKKLQTIRRRFGGASISRLGITSERLTYKGQEDLVKLFSELGYTEEKLYFATHADAFSWYEISEGNTDRKRVSIDIDFDGKGMLAYVLHPMSENKKFPFYVETTDYSDSMDGGIDLIKDEKQKTAVFSQMIEKAINGVNMARLYVTGKYSATQSATDILSGFSASGRRIFSGKTLYAQGACYYAVKEKLSRPVIFDRQIFHNVFISAYRDSKEESIMLLKYGTPLKVAKAKMQVILDGCDELSFKVDDLRSGGVTAFSVKPDLLPPRENRTVRLEITVSFLDYETLVIKVRDIGFGNIYPATYKVYEQIISLM